MVMKLDDVVPFGRSLDEYQKMFNLTQDELTLNILGVADGPASFNAELTENGGNVTSIDPVFEFNAKEIQKKYLSVADDIIEQVKSTPSDWVWSYHKSPDDLRDTRDKVTEKFVSDFDKNRDSTRYVIGGLPNLPFSDGEFDLALCSHFLFLYSNYFTYEFHLQSIREMLRVAREVRIFPLLTLMLDESPYVESLEKELTLGGYSVEISRAKYELQKGGNKMMVVRKNS